MLCIPEVNLVFATIMSNTDLIRVTTPYHIVGLNPLGAVHILHTIKAGKVKMLIETH